MLLSGDIGGTKTRLALAEVTGGRVQIHREQRFTSQHYATFEDLLGEFLADEGGTVAAAFGVAGPVNGTVAQATNLPWRLDAAVLRARFGFSRCHLLNDLEATAWGLSALGADDLLTLQTGVPDARGNRAIIAAGTGLGEAGLYWDGQLHHPFATEGGHTTFSPRDALEITLLQYLQQRHRHISWERVVSGMALPDLYTFLLEQRNQSMPAWLAQDVSGPDAAAISAAALQQRDALCVETLNWFVRLYGAEAGNLALKTMSRGGIYIGGGIAPKIVPLLQSGGFLDAFNDKGRMRPLLEAMPVRLILNDRAALYGPALYAAQQEAV